MNNPLNTEAASSTDMNIIDYTKYRNAFWMSRYPISNLLYNITKVVGWILVGISVIFLLGSMTKGGFFQELGLIILAAGVFAGLILLFISEMILFQIDKNFFSYVSIKNNLIKLENENAE